MKWFHWCVYICTLTIFKPVEQDYFSYFSRFLGTTKCSSKTVSFPQLSSPTFFHAIYYWCTLQHQLPLLNCFWNKLLCVHVQETMIWSCEEEESRVSKFTSCSHLLSSPLPEEYNNSNASVHQWIEQNMFQVSSVNFYFCLVFFY